MRPARPPRQRTRRLLAGVVSTALAAGALMLLPGAAQAAPPTDGLVLSYDLTAGTGTTVTDLSPNGRNGTIVGGATYSGGALVLDGVDDHVKLPNNLMQGLSSITVSTEVLVDPTAPTSNFFLWNLGNTAIGSPASGTGYLAATSNTFRAFISNQWWNAEENTAPSPGRALARNVFKTVTYTQTGTTGVLYEDGVEVGRKTNVRWLPSAIGNGTTTRNVIGESAYDADTTLKGKLRSFQIYDRALTAAEVRTLAPSDADLVAADKAALDLGNLSAVTSNLTLPATGNRGSTITWSSSAPAVISNAGVVTRPTSGSPAASVVLTASITRGSVTDTKTFTATVPADESPQAKANAAAAALTLVEPDDVRGNLTLPTTGINGSTVTWASSNAAVVSTTGIVTRPASGNASVTMTATVTVGTATATKQVVLTVKQAPVAEPMEGYAFSYFTGNSIAGEKIYFAASRGNNALQWDELNGGQPVLESTFGRKGLRDPFLIRSPEGDTFYLIATDLSVGGGDGFDQRTGSRYLEVWESHDLITWSEQRHVLVSPPTAGNTWAPEAYWDEATQSYAVFWASQLYPESDPNHTTNSYNRMLIANTRDFRTFTEPTIWQDPGKSRIDSTVIEEDGVYHRFTKDEGGSTYNCSDIIQEKSTSLTAPLVPGNASWSVVDACIGGKAGTRAVEGPTAFEANPGDTSPYNYYLFVDEYGGRGYIPLGTDDLTPPAGGGVNGVANWKVPSTFRLPASPRHGTVIPVTAKELAALRSTIPVAQPVKATPEGVVASYPLSGDAKDASGNGYDGTIAGNPTFADGALNLDGTDDHVRLPNNIMAGLDAITVTSQVWVDSTQAGSYFLWGLGNSSGAEGNGYLFTTGNAYRAAIASGNYTTEQGLTSGSNLPRGQWKTITYTQDADGKVVLYLDGRQVATRTGVTVRPGDVGQGFTTANYIGRSLYSGDTRLKGKVRNFSIWNRALSPTEVAGQAAGATDISSVTLDSLKVPAIFAPSGSTITLPVKPGTDLANLAPVYGTKAGSTISPAGGRDYRAPVQLTVTGADGSTKVWTVRAVVMSSPLIPGLYADPNIAKFGDTYYLYATTDGFPGWGGKEFYVWKSKNLAEWTRSATPFLTLDGANGNVPWATGNAWAPTIIERGGKYYFYFSGHEPTANRKMIGVAVADSPEGPFTARSTPMITNGETVTSGQAIDPAAFKDPVSGKHYLYWGNGQPVMAELADDMVSLVPGTIQRMTGLTDYREGSFMNYRQGLYHLTYAIDDTGSPNYRVGYATGTSPTGPWTYRGVILEKDESQGILGTGHSSIVQTGTDTWAIAYHRFAIPGGGGTNRETTIDALTFDPVTGLMQKVVPTLTGITPLVTATAPGAPGAPVVSGVTTTGATVTWTAPTSDGGSPVTGYQVVVRQGTTTVSTTTVTGLTTTLTGLTPATAYTVTVAATNTAGTGTATAATSFTTATPVTAPGTPGAPVVSGVTTTGATVTWTAPTSTGGSPVTGYQVVVRQGTTTVSTTTVTGLTTTLSGLTPGTAYTVTVAAANTAGTGTATAATSFTTATPVTAPGTPGAPVVSGVTTTGATVTWTAPTTTGGSPVTGYQVVVRRGTTTVSTTTVTGLTTTLSGLTPGTAHTVTVAATNTAGTGTATTPVTFTTATEPVVTPPVVIPPVVVPPVVTPPLPPVQGPGLPATAPVTAEVKGKPKAGKPARLVITTAAATGTVVVKAAGRKYSVTVRDGRAVVKVRFTKPGKQKIVLKTAGSKKVMKVRVRR